VEREVIKEDADQEVTLVCQVTSVRKEDLEIEVREVTKAHRALMARGAREVKKVAGVKQDIEGVVEMTALRELQVKRVATGKRASAGSADKTGHRD
jgi:hypothetical protein